MIFDNISSPPLISRLLVFFPLVFGSLLVNKTELLITIAIFVCMLLEN